MSASLRVVSMSFLLHSLDAFYLDQRERGQLQQAVDDRPGGRIALTYSCVQRWSACLPVPDVFPRLNRTEGGDVVAGTAFLSEHATRSGKSVRRTRVISGWMVQEFPATAR